MNKEIWLGRKNLFCVSVDFSSKIGHD